MSEQLVSEQLRIIRVSGLETSEELLFELTERQYQAVLARNLSYPARQLENEALSRER